MKGRMENGGLFTEYEAMQEKLRKRPEFPELPQTKLIIGSKRSGRILNGPKNLKKNPNHGSANLFD
jgi:hypothetical protein